VILLLAACGYLPSLDAGAAPLATWDQAPDCASEGVASPPRNCLSGALACGSTISGTTLGGDSAWGDKFYATEFCFPTGDHHSGAERVYTLTAPENTQVTITMLSECVDLDLIALAWQYEGTCPTEKHLVPECEADAKKGGYGVIKIQSFAEKQYLVAVDGKRGAVGPFTLSVTCAPLRPLEDRLAAPEKR
jgi:hypothetical protein